MPVVDPSASRRSFLAFLAGSPLLAWSGSGALANETPSRLPDPMAWAPRDVGEPIKSPKDAVNVFDFERAAYKNVPPAHFGYMAAGIDDEVTLRANREAFSHFVLRPRRLVDVTNVDPSVRKA
jgi:4-hydroxymandelate oxidase